MPKDLLGNELHEGCLVRASLTENAVIGKIIKLTEGGVSLPGQKGQSPGEIVIQCFLPLQFPSQRGADIRLASLLRVVDPEEQAAVEKLAGGDTGGGPVLVEKPDKPN